MQSFPKPAWAATLECDPVELVIDEDLPKQMKETKKRGNGNEA